VLEQKQIKKLFYKLNAKLKANNEKGEIGIVGGAVMCLVYNARASTKDVDAIFEPAKIIRDLAVEIAKEEGLPEDWLNDGAKSFIQPYFQREQVLDLSHLRVWAPDARYMLAMKCISARFDTSDKDDVIFLLKNLELKKAEDVYSIIESYYPRNEIPAKTKFFIEEILA
tara:strand:- start:5068 stop:5574 length:507 start_codon:yes stop_codon:yes gene_type:complete